MFKNLKVAFEDKSDKDLNRAFILFKTISNPLISKILTICLRAALVLRLPINNIVKKTVYKHFCGGTSIKNSEKTILKLWDSKIGTILDFSSEGKECEKDFNNVMNETIASLNKGKLSEKIPFSVFKPTGLARFNLLEKISSESELNNKEKKEKADFIKRIDRICKVSSKNKVPVFIDAEESWIQNAIDKIAIKMMKKYNIDQPWIFNTLQLYRTDRIEYLDYLIKRARKNNFYLGLKIVRGAYHEQEVARAREKGYKCPVHVLKKDTDKDYDEAIKLCVRNIDIISVCAGTHNEKSSILLIDLLKKHKITKNDKRVYLSQLLGMSDNISYNAAKKGYNVAKYVPYGPVKDVMPYLIRRAEENTSISGQMGRELSNIIDEKKRRKSS